MLSEKDVTLQTGLHFTKGRRLRSAPFLCYRWPMVAWPSLNPICVLALAIGLGVIFLSYGPVGSLSRWLGTKSHLDERNAKEEGVPVWITGNFERLLAFFLVLLHVEGAFTLIALWLGAKLAASWHRLATEPYGDAEKREYNRQIRAGTLCALIAGIVSVLIGALVGLIIRNVCQCCVLT